MMEWLAFMLLLCSYGAEIMENHQDNLWSLSAQKYFWLEEPEIIKKILNWFLPVGHKKDSFYSIDSCSSLFCPELPDFPDYGETRIQEIMCFITWITINAHEFFINFFL